MTTPTLREAVQRFVDAYWLGDLKAMVAAESYAKAALAQPDECPDCAEMAKQRDHYREKSRANSSGQLAEELSCALARIERLELALEAWEETYSPCEHDPNYPSWCLTHHTKRCNVEEARRLTEEARK